MAKTTPKTAPKKSAAREFAEKEAASAAPAPVKTRNRSAVLVKKTPAELAKLIGEDTPLGVSRKELKNIILNKQLADIDGGL